MIVAHPDDEVLWAGGTILAHEEWDWHIYALCRAGDADRAPRFRRALAQLRAVGAIGDLDDGPDQAPLDSATVRAEIVSLLRQHTFDRILTHGPRGEYTRHRRHEETCRAVVELWQRGELETRELWLFAFTDADRRHLPVAIRHAHRYQSLSQRIWNQKYRLVVDTYGFNPESWEARTTPTAEAFWCFDDPQTAWRWIHSHEEPQ